MNIVISGGGTSGHLTPAVAIADEFKRRDKNNRITFILRDGGAENSVVYKKGYPVVKIKI